MKIDSLAGSPSTSTPRRLSDGDTRTFDGELRAASDDHRDAAYRSRNAAYNPREAGYDPRDTDDPHASNRRSRAGNDDRASNPGSGAVDHPSDRGPRGAVHARRATTHDVRHDTRAGSIGANDSSDDGANDAATAGTTATAAPDLAAALGVIHTVAAAVVRATTATPGKAAGDEAAADAITATAASAAVDAAEPTTPAVPLTPLEQAVHELLDELGQLDEHTGSKRPAPEGPSVPALLAPMPLERPALPPAVAAPVARAEHALAERPMPTSHVHLVLDDGPERVVVTVAVRGSDVHVALRANDEMVSASLARNAAILDHAMRARGLVLAELQTDTPPERDRKDREPPPEPHRNAEPFELEENS